MILINHLGIQDARTLIDEGIVSGGMIPKVTCCIRALAQGVQAAHILDGRIPHALLLEIFTEAGIGSMLVASSKEQKQRLIEVKESLVNERS